MPDDALLPILPFIRRNKGARAWNHFQHTNKLWKSLTTATTTEPTSTPLSTNDNNTTFITTKDIKNSIKQHRQTKHHQRCQQKNNKLINQCRKKIGVDPILWLPMTSTERILCIYYRLGWITNHQHQSGPNCHQTTRLSKHHLLTCHNVHGFLSISQNNIDPILFVLNRLPKSPPKSSRKRLYLQIIWPKLCFILHQLHRTCRPTYYTTPSPSIDNFGQPLLKWIEPPIPPTTVSSLS